MMKKLIMTLGLSLAVSSSLSAQNITCPTTAAVGGVLDNDTTTTTLFAGIAPSGAQSYFHQAMANGLTLSSSGNDCTYSYNGSNIVTISLENSALHK